MVEFVSRRLKTDYSIEELHKAYPFHGLFFRDEAIIAFRRQRSIVTSMGITFYPTLARIIAEERCSDVHVNREIVGPLSEGTLNAIGRITSQLRARQRKPDHKSEVEEILAARGGPEREAKMVADVFIGDLGGGPFFAELKSYGPNLDICAETKSKILMFCALNAGLNGEAYLALYYNPWVTRQAYAHSFTRQIMDMEAEVLIGEEFWEKVGGEGTFAELLDIVAEVRDRTQPK